MVFWERSPLSLRNSVCTQYCQRHEVLHDYLAAPFLGLAFLSQTLRVCRRGRKVATQIHADKKG